MKLYTNKNANRKIAKSNLKKEGKTQTAQK